MKILRTRCTGDCSRRPHLARVSYTDSSSKCLDRVPLISVGAGFKPAPTTDGDWSSVSLGKPLNITTSWLQNGISSVPELAKAFTHAIKSMENLGKSLEETKRLRWNVLREMAVARELSPDQILEAMRILAEIEQQERVDWTSVFKTVAKVFGALAFVILAIVAAVTGLGRTTQREET